jgi:glucosamine kinase
MIDFLIGVDGGGSGTRVRVARPDGSELGVGHGGPSGLGLGVERAWAAVDVAVTCAFETAGAARPPLSRLAIGLGLAGVHNRQWAAAFEAANPGYAAVALGSDGLTTLLGAHQGRPGAIVALGTGSVGEVLYADGSRREVSGWGFPAGDEASGAWIGLRAVSHMQQAVDGRAPGSAFADALIAACGGQRDAIQVWLAGANQTAYAQLARLVLEHGRSNGAARAILDEAGRQAAQIAAALDPSGSLPVALCGGLATPLRPYMPESFLRRVVPAHGDSAAGGLLLVQRELASESESEAAPC